MIDINELRRLAQAATPGPWSVVEYDHAICVQTESASKSKYGASRYAAIGGFDRSDPAQLEEARANARIIAAANPAAISELLDRLEAAESEALEEARLNGMGSEREAALLSKLEAAEKERDELRARIERMERQEPVAWAATDETCRVVEALSFNQSRRFDTPLYLLPGAKGE